jgi:hypothetical protein
MNENIKHQNEDSFYLEKQTTLNKAETMTTKA